LREIHRWPTIEIHPDTAARLGIAEGTWCYVENQLGRARMMAHLTPILKEDTVSCDHGWWLPESDPEELFDSFKYNINHLIPHEQNGPLGFGTHYKAGLCKVYPVPAEEAIEVPASPERLLAADGPSHIRSIADSRKGE
jgi:anaerobic selenocysteine-containing dehydrogenase